MPIRTSIQSVEELQTTLENNPGLVLIKFSATWCNPCKKIAPLIDPYIANVPQNVDFYLLDIDDNFEIYGYFKSKKRVSGIPAVLCWKKGNTSYIPDDCTLGANLTEMSLFLERVSKYTVDAALLWSS